jgi:uncharacterized phiE125 gp8 family phage protein
MHYIPLDTTTEPILTLEQAKKQLKMEDLGTFDDEFIEGCIEAAIKEVENYINTSIKQQKWKLVMSNWSQYLEPKKQKITAITKISYHPKDGTDKVEKITAVTIDAFVQLLPVDDYATKLSYKNFDNIPEVADQDDAIEIEFQTGLATANVPADLLHAIKLLLTDNYNFRNTRSRVKSYVDSSRVLMEPYKYYTNG